MEARSILVPFVWGIGNMVLFTPALCALRKAWPRARIAVLATRAGVADVVSGGALADDVHVIGPGRLERSWWLARTALRHDVAVSPVPLPSRLCCVLLLISGAQRRVGFAPRPVEGAASLLERHARTDSVVFDETRHEVENYLGLLGPLGVVAAGRALHVAVSDVDRERARKAMDAHGLSPRRFVALHVGAHADMLGKCWPPERFARLAGAIGSDLGITPVLVGGPDDGAMVAAVRGRAGRGLVDLSGRLSVKETAALFEGARVVVANDSGPMHLAAAVGAPVVGIFGPTNPRKNSPWTVRGRGEVVRVDIPCSPCYRIGGTILCQPHRCLEALEADAVLAALERLMARTGGPAGTGGIPPDAVWGPAESAPVGSPLAPCGPVSWLSGSR